MKFELDLDETMELHLPPGENDIAARCLVRKAQHLHHRAYSEKKLFEILPAQLQPGHSYHCISGGDIDSLSYLKHIVKQQPLHYVLFSTWCMALEDIAQFQEWLTAGTIKRLDAYCGEIFPNSYRKEHLALSQLIRTHGGRLAIFRNHSKIYAGIGDDYSFAIESSANINTNPRAENTTITIDTDIYQFYKNYFDAIKSYNRDFDTWEPWQP